MIKSFASLLIMSAFVFSCAVAQSEPQPGAINSFETCVAAGNPVMRSYPARCAGPDGVVYQEKVAKLEGALAENAVAAINSFKDCQGSGFPVVEGVPRRCFVGDRVFVEPEVDPKTYKGPIKGSAKKETLVGNKICIDSCGNGLCEEIVCLGEKCPCAESKTTCPKDCP